MAIPSERPEESAGEEHQHHDVGDDDQGLHCPARFHVLQIAAVFILRFPGSMLDSPRSLYEMEPEKVTGTRPDIPVLSSLHAHS